MEKATLTYQKFADYYDLYVGSFDYDLNCYLSFCKKNDHILEVGCGTGRVLDAFLKNDYSITGIDISDEMLEKAKQKLNSFIRSGKLQLLNHDFSETPLEERYNRIIVSFFTFNYIIEKPLEFLRNMHKSMAPEAFVMMDLFKPFSDTLNKNHWKDSTISKNEQEIKIRDNRYIEGNLEFRTQIYDENGVQTKIETQRRYFSPQELKDLFEHSGFRNIEFSLNYDNSSFSSCIDDSLIDRHFLIKAQK